MVGAADSGLEGEGAPKDEDSDSDRHPVTVDIEMIRIPIPSSLCILCSAGDVIMIQVLRRMR